MAQVRKELMKEGDASMPVRAGCTITVHCTGYLATDPLKKFWSTKDPGQQPFSFKVGVGKVIKGWDDGCLTMCVGESSRLNIPSHLGYGSAGFPSWGIPQNADLVFDIEVLSCV